ncbi:hypothetical protein Har1130_08530 [Haloarcula sp. CBA1130]|uniref:hypothetical protein n=1 Tax=unclassified Haloarcula TaxID=2624677 RepID=UPI001244A0EC|nr:MULTISPECIES: hypothetical protein [unclassified Haloarcula]KAA9397179.1 hypothetical protein Har1129_02540 [Haloarcula sp. CBA1129]KAA9402784.1 hypothetical protein Har1130_08530 [Haloarcula sp. CBA1130]
MATANTATYEAFGLTVRSAFDVPELPLAEPEPDGRADITITEERIPCPLSADSSSTFHAVTEREYYLLYDAATVRILDGKSIAVDPASDVPSEVLRHVLVGPALNHLLDQRGYFVLHASTVSIDGRAVAFVGESGVGKTTTAMACLLNGHRVLSDDVAAITLGDSGPVVRSGYPSMKLDPEAVEAFDPPVEPPEQVHGGRPRHFYGLRHDQPATPVPLERIYLLEDGESIAMEPVRPDEQVMALVDNTYTLGALEADGQAVSNFNACGKIVEMTDIRRLRRPRNLDTLPAVAASIQADLDSDSC